MAARQRYAYDFNYLEGDKIATGSGLALWHTIPSIKDWSKFAKQLETKKGFGR